MPVVRFEVRNEYGHADPQLYGAADRDDPEALLEGVAMAGLVGVLRQLGDLAEFAAGIFHNLHEEVMATSARGHNLMLRVQQLESEIPAIENTSLSHITHLQAVHNAGIEWHPNIQIDRNLITGGDMPRFILDSYEECRGPPRLFMLDKFDVAGAGACLKRYSDPSFFKNDFASTRAIEPELQREKRTRKSKKKIPRWRIGENLETTVDPHITILNHMQSGKAPPNVPAKRVKLKMRPLNIRDDTTKSDMECILQRHITSADVLCGNIPENKFLEAISVDSGGPGIEVWHSPPKLAVIPNKLELENDATPRLVSSGSGLETGAKIEDHTRQVVDGQCTNEGEEALQVTGKSFTSNELGAMPRSSSYPEMIKNNLEGSLLEKHAKTINAEFKEEISGADSENKTDAGSDIYVSDDIASEADNFMDALATIDSETEIDTDNIKSQHTFNLGFETLDSEQKEDKEKQCIEALNSDLGETVTDPTNKAAFCALSGSNLVHKDQGQILMNANLEIFSDLENKTTFHALSALQSFHVDEIKNQLHENSEISSAFDSCANSKPDFGRANSIMAEPENHQEEFVQLSCFIPESNNASCSFPVICATSSMHSGSHLPETVQTIATPSALCTGAIDSCKHSQMADDTSVGNSSTSGHAVSNNFSSSYLEQVEILNKHHDSSCESLQDILDLPVKEESTSQAGYCIDDVFGASSMQIPNVEIPTSSAQPLQDKMEPACGLEEPTLQAGLYIDDNVSDSSSKQSPDVEIPTSSTKLRDSPSEVIYLEHAIDNKYCFGNIITKMHDYGYLDGSSSDDHHSCIAEETVHCHQEKFEFQVPDNNFAFVCAKIDDPVYAGSPDPLPSNGTVTASKHEDSEHPISISSGLKIQTYSTDDKIFTLDVYPKQPRSSFADDTSPDLKGPISVTSGYAETEFSALNRDQLHFESLSSEMTASCSAYKIQTCNADAEVFTHNVGSPKQPGFSFTDGTPPDLKEAISYTSDDAECKFSALNSNRSHQQSSCLTSVSFDASLTKGHPSTLDLVYGYDYSKDSIVGEWGYSSIGFPSTILSKDDNILDAPPKDGPQNKENLALVQDDSIKFVASNTSDCSSFRRKEGILTLCDNVVDREDESSLSNSESPVPNKDLATKKLYSDCLNSEYVETNETCSLQTDVEQVFGREMLQKSNFIPSDVPQELIDISPETFCSGNEGFAIVAHFGEPNERTTIQEEHRELDHAKLHECLKTPNKEEVELDDFPVTPDEMIVLPDSSHADNAPVDCQSEKIEAVNLSGKFSILRVGSDAGLITEYPYKKTMEDDTSGVAPVTLIIPLAADLASSEPSCCNESSLNVETSTGKVQVVELSISDNLFNQQPSDMPEIHMQDCINEVLETNMSLSSDISQKDSLREEAICSSSSGGPNPFTISMTSIIGSDQSLSCATTSTVQVHPEVAVTQQHKSEVMVMPSEDTLKAPLACVSSISSLGSPGSTNTSQGLCNGIVVEFPATSLSTVNGDFNDIPPLPPLPPVQWRTGKTIFFPQGLTSIISKPPTGSNTFEQEYLGGNPERGLDLVDLRMQGINSFNQQTDMGSLNSHHGQINLGKGSSLEPNDLSSEQAAWLRHNSVSIDYHEGNAEARSIDTYGEKLENAIYYPETAQEEKRSTLESFAPMLTSAKIDSHFSSALRKDQEQLFEQSASLLTPGFDVPKNSTVFPQNIQMDLHSSNTVKNVPLIVDPRYQYGYRLIGGESLQPLDMQGIDPRHGFFVPLVENFYAPYSMMPPEVDTQKPVGRPLSIFNRPRDPLIEAVASHDKSTLRKVSEIVQSSKNPKDTKSNPLLDQIKQMSFSLKPTVASRPSVKGPTTNLKVAAILEKAKALRQACAGSDDEDNWSDGST